MNYIGDIKLEVSQTDLQRLDREFRELDKKAKSDALKASLHAGGKVLLDKTKANIQSQQLLDTGLLLKSTKLSVRMKNGPAMEAQVCKKPSFHWYKSRRDHDDF